MATQRIVSQTRGRRTSGARSSSARGSARPSTQPSWRRARPRAPTAPRGRTATSVTSVDRVQVQRLLDRFCEAFTNGDGRTAAACFSYPSLMVMGNGAQSLEDEDSVAGFFDNAPAQYRPKGIFDTRADITAIERLNGRLLLVHTHWPYFDENGRALGDGESSVYLVRQEPRGKAVIAAAIPLGTDSERGSGGRSSVR